MQQTSVTFKPIKACFNKSRIVFGALMVISLTIAAQPTKWKSKKYLTVVSYNVENLFDTIKDPSINDNEFLPDSKKAYNSKRYNEKLDNLSKVISSINQSEFPEIIGLVEVENKSVLIDLVNRKLLKPANYQVILEEGPDPRGIDCGLLYRPDVFKYISHKPVEVRFPKTNARTRDILYVKGMVRKDTLHVFVNHWTSRRSGASETEYKRMHCAKVLSETVDSIIKTDAKANIIIMGDFNDEPGNKSLHEILGAGKIDEQKPMVNLMYGIYQQKKGSYYYNGKYDMIDNLVVTRALLNKNKGLRLFDDTGWIYSPEFICYTQKNGDKSPNRSYGGNNYYGGYSDHFPIYTIFYEK